LVDAAGLVASRPGKPLFDGVSVTVASGDRLAVVGLNGCGKSTLLGALAGSVTPEAGSVRRGRGTRVVVLDQAATLPPGTVRTAAGDGWESEAVLDRLGMGALLDADVGALSGGQAKRVALARALVAVGESSESDLLILDEPTNHLDLDAIAWLEDRLAAFKGGLVLVTHDRHVLDRVTTRILELDRGAGYLHDGGYASYLGARADRAEREVVTEHKRRNLARSELAWLRRGAPARTRKPKADVAKALAVVEGGPPPSARPEDLPLHQLTSTPRLGNTVVELHGVGDGYGDHLLFAGLDLALDPRARLGVVGPNGSGKSTLLDVVAGRRRPRSGRVVRGSTVRVGYYDQRGVDLPPDARVRELVAGPARQPDWSDAALLERLWFGTDAQWAPVRLLSGGERRRLQLALVLRQGPNVLLLDEPTNDLDLDTLRALEDMLDAWPGTLVVVSHDRAFLERTVEDVVVLDHYGERSSHVSQVPGGFAAYVASRRSRRRPGRAGPAVAAVRPAAPAGGARPRPEPAARRRTPSTLRHLLRRSQADLEKLRAQQSTLTAQLATVSDDHAKLAEVGERLSAVGAELAAAEEAWLALAEEAEAQGLAT
jgi:ATP-binding cassette subfamily F protein uup